jgi:hypothetical protein
MSRDSSLRQPSVRFTLLRTLREGWRQQNDRNSLFCVSPNDKETGFSNNLSSQVQYFILNHKISKY